MSFALNVHRFTAVLVVALSSAACSEPESKREPAASAAAETACRDALRDVRTWCAGGLREANPGSRYNCLDARLRFDRNCYPG